MNKHLMTLICMGAFIAPALADKPEWAGKGAPSAEQQSAHESAMQAKGNYDDHGDKIKKQKKEHIGDEYHSEKMQHEHLQKQQREEDRIKNQDHSGELKGLEKQQAKKSEQTQKELGKGSEKGQAAREEHSKKWWKFWGE